MFSVSVLLAELWAVKDGLQRCWDLGFQNDILESDSQEALSYIVSPEVPKQCVLILSMHARTCSQSFGKFGFRIQPALREANKLADHLAKAAAHQEDTFVIFDSPPVFVIKTMMLNFEGKATPRCVALNS